jgi:hypothetical protein
LPHPAENEKAQQSLPTIETTPAGGLRAHFNFSDCRTTVLPRRATILRWQLNPASNRSARRLESLGIIKPIRRTPITYYCERIYEIIYEGIA